MKKILFVLITVVIVTACDKKESVDNTKAKYEVIENEKTKRLDSLYTSHF